MPFDLNEPTLQRVETGTSSDLNTMRRLQIYIEFPDVALWHLELSGHRISNETLERLKEYFRGKATNRSASIDK
jgi:hypothetical protein